MGRKGSCHLRMYRNGRVVNLRDNDERWIASLDRMDIRGNEHERINNDNRHRNIWHHGYV